MHMVILALRAKNQISHRLLNILTFSLSLTHTLPAQLSIKPLKNRKTVHALCAYPSFSYAFNVGEAIKAYQTNSRDHTAMLSQLDQSCLHHL